LTELFQR